MQPFGFRDDRRQLHRCRLGSNKHATGRQAEPVLPIWRQFTAPSFLLHLFFIYIDVENNESQESE